jgi:hypothetical protein
VNTNETRYVFSREDDLFEALTYAIACSKSAHEGLHAFEIGLHFATCARTIEGVVDLVVDLLPQLAEMVDRVRDEGRSWTSLTLDEKDRLLRRAFETSQPRRVDDFAPLNTVWWEPFELVINDIQPPASGCPAWVARWDRLRLERGEPSKTPLLFALTAEATGNAAAHGNAELTPGNGESARSVVGRARRGRGRAHDGGHSAQRIRGPRSERRNR